MLLSLVRVCLKFLMGHCVLHPHQIPGNLPKEKLRLGCIKMQINPYDLKKREKKYPLGKIKAQLHTDGQGSENLLRNQKYAPCSVLFSFKRQPVQTYLLELGKMC